MNRKIKVRKVFRVDVPPESNHEDFRHAERINHSSFSYDEQEHVTEDVKYDDFGNETGRQKFNYDERGFLIGEETYNETGELEEKLTFESNEKGLLLKKNVHYLDDTFDTLSFEYDGDKLIRKVLADEQGEVEAEEIFTYNGDLLTVEQKYEEGKLVYRNTFEYDETGKVTESKIINEDEEARLVNEYDENGNKIGFFKYNELEKLIEKHLMVYDEKGNVVEIIEEDPYKKTTVRLVYDDKNNASSQQELNREGILSHEVQRDYDGDGNLTEVRAVIMGPDQQAQRKYMLVYEYEFWD